MIESLRSDKQRIGAPGESRPGTRPVLWENPDADGSKQRRLRDAVPDDRLDRIDTVDDWGSKLDAGPDEDLSTKTACAERARAFFDIMDGKEPRIAAGNAFRTGESRVEMWEWFGGRPGWRGYDPALGTPEAFTADTYAQLERSMRGSPPGTVAYLGVEWYEGSSHAFGAFVDRHGRLRWWDANQRLYDGRAPVTGPWPRQTRAIRGAEVAMRRPGGRWLTPGPDGRWGELRPLPDEVDLIDFRYPQADRPVNPGSTPQSGDPIGPPGNEGEKVPEATSGEIGRLGRNEFRAATSDGGSPVVRLTAREAVGPDARGRHIPADVVDRLVPPDAKVNAEAWKRMGDEWDRSIGSGYEVHAEFAPSQPGTRPGRLRVLYESVDPQTGRTVGHIGRAVFDHTGTAVLLPMDGRVERFEHTGTPTPMRNLPPDDGRPIPQVHHGNARRKDFAKLFPELVDVNPDRPGLPRRRNWMNCEGSVIAAELTLRGHPSSAVMADPYELDGHYTERMPERIGVPSARFRSVRDFRAIAREIYLAGDGARGAVAGFRSFLGIPTSGHVFLVVNRNGRVYYVDPQQRTWARLERFSAGLKFLRTNYGSNEGQPHGAE